MFRHSIGRSPPCWRGRQVAVDQVRLQVRLDQRHDDDDLIDVGDQHVLPAARGPRQHAVPRLDALDHPLGAARLPERRSRTHPDPVAGRDDAALVGRQALEQPADGTAMQAAVRRPRRHCRRPWTRSTRPGRQSAASDAGMPRSGCRPPAVAPSSWMMVRWRDRSPLARTRSSAVAASSSRAVVLELLGPLLRSRAAWCGSCAVRRGPSSWPYRQDKHPDGPPQPGATRWHGGIMRNTYRSELAHPPICMSEQTFHGLGGGVGKRTGPPPGDKEGGGPAWAH